MKAAQAAAGVGARVRVERAERRLTQISVSVTTQTCQEPISPSVAQGQDKKTSWLQEWGGKGTDQGSLAFQPLPTAFQATGVEPTVVFPEWKKGVRREM